ncbi:MAG: imidazole glycerol phosphate synthase subunit HisH [Eubacterium sp.]|nr:imidazole glycerol phosphate synthase subunit HisH [Eubacterium sp.]
MIAVVDYDAGNIKSVEKALQYIGEKPVITREISQINKADKVIVPGVGAFEDAMGKMNRYHLTETLRKVAASGTPIMGICLGLQLFFERSDESEHDVEGLGLLPGEIVRFPEKEGYKIPHMGWNSLKINPSSRLLKGIPEDTYVYFVHSYYLQAKHEEDVAATTDYIVNVHAAVEHDNVFATQFHPEKSGDVGLEILKNFASI